MKTTTEQANFFALKIWVWTYPMPNGKLSFLIKRNKHMLYRTGRSATAGKTIKHGICICAIQITNYVILTLFYRSLILPTALLMSAFRNSWRAASRHSNGACLLKKLQSTV